MIKWKSLDFKECHIWSKNSQIQEIYDSLTEEKHESLEIFVV